MSSVEVPVGSGLRIRCSRDEFVQTASVVTRAVSARASVQILSGVLVRAEGSQVELAATDMDLSLRSSLTAEVGSAGTVVVPGRLLLEIARLLPDEDVMIEHSSEEGSARIVSGPASYRLHTYNADDFPRLPAVEDGALFTVDRDVFLETAARVSRSASRDESRPVLTGVLVRFEEGKLVMIATDAYRLAVKETALGDSGPALEAIIPARALAELARIPPAAGELELGLHENHAIFGDGSFWLTTRRIDGQFPDYRQLFPESFESELRLPKGEFLDVVRRSAVMAQRNSPLRLRFSEGELTVFAQTQDVGEARESIPVGYTGEPLEIGFNADFLREGIEAVEGDEVTLKLISPLRPAVLTDSEGDFSYLIMPIRLPG